MGERIGLIGLGLIGGSLGLALRGAKPDRVVVGYAPRASTRVEALRVRAIDVEAHSVIDAVKGADLVIISVPVVSTRRVFEEIAPHLSPGTVVTDVGSTKAQVLAWADELLPAGVHFVGGHPMAGKETSGIKAAQADLFQGCTYCIMPSLRAPVAAVERVAALAREVGGRPHFFDPVEHDSFVAGISHLPAAVAAALVNTVSRQGSWPEMATLAAGGFRDTTRVASCPPEMYRDICLTNRDALSRWLQLYIGVLCELREAVEQGDEEVERFFAQAKEARDQWVAGKVSPEPPPLAMPQEGLKDMIAQGFLGGAFRRRRPR